MEGKQDSILKPVGDVDVDMLKILEEEKTAYLRHEKALLQKLVEVESGTVPEGSLQVLKQFIKALSCGVESMELDKWLAFCEMWRAQPKNNLKIFQEMDPFFRNWIKMLFIRMQTDHLEILKQLEKQSFKFGQTSQLTMRLKEYLNLYNSIMKHIWIIW